MRLQLTYLKATFKCGIYIFAHTIRVLTQWISWALTPRRQANVCPTWSGQNPYSGWLMMIRAWWRIYVSYIRQRIGPSLALTMAWPRPGVRWQAESYEHQNMGLGFQVVKTVKQSGSWCTGDRRPVNSPHKWPVTRKMFPFDDVIMRRVVRRWEHSDGSHSSITRLLWL